MEHFLVFSILDIVLIGLTTALFAVQMVYYLVTYMRPLRMAKADGGGGGTEEAGKQPPVSVIVYAKNESYNLQRYLPSLLTQDYPVFEVIVINDGSTDESDDVLKRFENQYENLYHTFIPQESKYLSRRKLSLTIGIKAAKHHYLLFTEANCQPMSKNWITAMMRNYDAPTEIVIGFCAYRVYKGFFHKLVSYDNLITGLQYISSALNRKPFSGSGRNLSYRTELFFEHKGFSKSLSLHAGDDDLFINEAATGKNTRMEYSPDSITEMAPFERFAVWKEMKVSRAATQTHYRGKELPFYRLEKLSFILFLLAAIASFAVGMAGHYTVSILAVLLYLALFITHSIVLKKSAKMLRQKLIAGWLPLLEIVHPLMNFYVYIYRFFRGKKDYTFTLGGK